MRILVAIASYGTANDRYLIQLLEEYRSMPFDVHPVILSNIQKEIAPGVESVVGLLGKNPWSLPFGHKKIFAERLQDYDLFIYSEDDILITAQHIRAFLNLYPVLSGDEIPGFLRFEVGPTGERNYPDVHCHFRWEPGSLVSRGRHKVAFFTNEHAGCYVLTRQQLQSAIASGGFLVPPHSERYGLPESAATDPYTQCGFKKLVCISHLDDFLVHHLPNKYVGRLGVGGAEFARQTEALLKSGHNESVHTQPFQTESKLMGWRFSKDYYEAAREDIFPLIPKGARNILSIGCGWGATERWLANKGFRVVAAPVNSIISAGLESESLEILTGNLNTLRESLRGNQFDCLFISNLLHLSENPVGLLSCFKDFLSPDGSAIIIVPNLSRLPLILRKLWRDERFIDLGSYEKTGVHVTSHRMVRLWFEDAGMTLEKSVSVLAARFQRIANLALGLADPLLASEIIAVAKNG